MALFERKSAYSKLVEDYHKLSPEDREKFHSEILDVEKAEDEREIDKVEEEKAETPEKEEEKAEEVKEESEEIGKEIDEAEETEKVDEAPVEANTEEIAEEVNEEVEEEHVPEVEELEQPKEDDRLDRLEELIKAIAEKVDTLAERKEEHKAFGLGAKGIGESREQLGTSADERKKYFGF